MSVATDDELALFCGALYGRTAMRAILLSIVLCAPAWAAPQLKPERPVPDDVLIVPGVRLFTWGGTELEVLEVEPDGRCHVRNVRTGTTSHGSDEDYEFPRWNRKELADMKRRAKQLPWDHPDY